MRQRFTEYAARASGFCAEDQSHLGPRTALMDPNDAN